MDWHNRRITVMGLGHFGGGAGAARWLARQGAKVTVTDRADAEVLAEALERLKEVPIAAYHLGGHQEDDFRSADMVVVNPAVRPGSPLVQIARDARAVVTTELELFLNHCPAERTIGITGSSGKSTTAAMTAAILRAAGRRVWLGGNLGGSLLEKLPEIEENDVVVLEISSFQLYCFSSQTRMPALAVVTNCTPNHFDWHGSWENYVAAKQKILTLQSPQGAVVLNTSDREAASWEPLVRGLSAPLYSMKELPPLAVPGLHNRQNAVCAAAAALSVVQYREAVSEGLQRFRGLPQRLEEFAVVDGRRFYNDTAATTPEAAIAALKTLDVPVWLLAGGKNKGFDFGSLAEAIGAYARGAAFFGTAREQLQTTVCARFPAFCSSLHEQLADALAWCLVRSKPGEAIVLSPACASTDQYRNFTDRGNKFVELVRALAGQIREERP